jgi:hypothetical protein
VRSMFHSADRPAPRRNSACRYSAISLPRTGSGDTGQPADACLRRARTKRLRALAPTCAIGLRRSRASRPAA